MKFLDEERACDHCWSNVEEHMEYDVEEQELLCQACYNFKWGHEEEEE